MSNGKRKLSNKTNIALKTESYSGEGSQHGYVGHGRADNLKGNRFSIINIFTHKIIYLPTRKPPCWPRRSNQ